MAQKIKKSHSPALKSPRFFVLLLIAAAGCATVSPPPVIERDAGSPGARASSAADITRPHVAAPGARTAPATSSSSPSPSSRSGAYYKDDGPGDNPPPDLDKIADARPRIEPLHRFANNPYNVFGRDYVPMKSMALFRQSGIASWYGKKFHGQRTSSGEVYDMYGMTAAHPTLPIPSYVRVSNQQNGRSVIVRVNDRGPFHAGRVIDLSFAAAFRLGYVIAGSSPVHVELLQAEEIVSLATKDSTDANVASARTAPTSSIQATQQPAATPTERASNPMERITVGAQSPLPPTPATANARSDAATGVYLQLGAFSARDNAESFRARVYGQVGWLNEAIEIFPRDGLFRLHLGPYRDREQASGMAERLRREIELNPVFVTR